MGNFRFRLEKVREHRQRLVDQCSVAVARATKQAVDLQEELKGLAEDIRRQGETMAQQRDGEVGHRDFLAGTAWLNHLHALREDLDRRLRRSLTDLEEARRELGAAWRDLEVMTRLRERQETDWRLAQDRRDRREMDEVGQQRVHRASLTRNAH